MTTDQKMAALNALVQNIGGCSLHMREPGDWYLSCSAEVGGNGVLSGLNGNGGSPEDAIQDAWEVATYLPPGRFLVVGAMTANRRHYRWNGFMWAEQPQ